jgi:hypothetical protein
MRSGSMLMAVLLGAGLVSAQSKLAVFEFEPVMADTGLTKVVATLLSDRLVDTRAFGAVVASHERPATVAAAASIAKSLGADQAILGSIARVGEGSIISYRLVSVPAGDVLLSDRASLGNESELDVVTERMARSIRDRKPFAATEQAGFATSAEVRSREAASAILFTTGYTFPIYNTYPKNPGTMLFTLDAAVTYELPQFMAMAQMGIIRGKEGFQDVHFELLGHKVFGVGDIATYLGGGLGIHRISMWGGNDDDGLSLTASGGVLLFRNNIFRIVGSGKATAVITQDIGTSYSGGLGFGLGSAGFGPTGKIKTPPACIYGALGVFFVTGLIVALST